MAVIVRREIMAGDRVLLACSIYRLLGSIPNSAAYGVSGFL